MSATAPASQRWLFGAAPDLLLGCGLAYLAIFALQGVAGDQLAAWVPGGLVVMLASLPHYGATLLRVYQEPEDRRRYRLFAVHASLLLAVLFVVGLRSALLGSLILTLYLTWSPWHYTGQNYGVFLMLARRRGASITPAAKRWVYASFMLSYALTVLAIHGGEPDATYAPVVHDAVSFRLLPLGIPAAVTEIAIPLLGLGYLLSLAVAGRLLLRRSRARDLGPSALLVLTQALWFAVPVAVRHLQPEGQGGPLAGIYTAYGFLWIAGAHAVQYLWVTTYYARASGAARGILAYLGRAALAGYAIWILPGVLFAPGLLGRLPYESGLALLVAAVVNLHHFVLDGAIWKLREGRVARYLLRPAALPEASAPIGPKSRRPWAVGLAWTAGAVAIAVALLGFVEEEFGFRRALARGDLARARTAVERLGWIGRDGPTLHREIGRQLVRLHQPGEARRAFEASLALHPTPETWQALAALAESGQDWPGALDAYQQALILDPADTRSLYRSGLAHLELGDPERAEELLARAAELAPDERVVGLSLERARRARERAGRTAGQ